MNALSTVILAPSRASHAESVLAPAAAHHVLGLEDAAVETARRLPESFLGIGRRLRLSADAIRRCLVLVARAPDRGARDRALGYTLHAVQHTARLLDLAALSPCADLGVIARGEAHAVELAEALESLRPSRA
jgi:hypothetical protein